MTITKAIQTKSLKGLTEVVERALAIYNVEAPVEPEVGTEHGQLPFSAIISEDTRWTLTAVAYASVVRATNNLNGLVDKKVEVAKLIALNATLRAMTGTPTNSIDELI